MRSIYILISLIQEVNGTKVNNKNYDERGRFICKKLKISKDWSEKRNSDRDWRSPNLQPASKRGKNSVEKKVRQCAATLCNHAAQSITRQTVCLSTISLSLSYTQFFKRPSPVVPNSSPRSNWSPTKRSKVQPQPSLTKIYIYIFEISNHRDLIHQMKTDFGQVLSRFQSFPTFPPPRREIDSGFIETISWGSSETLEEGEDCLDSMSFDES